VEQNNVVESKGGMSTSASKRGKYGETGNGLNQNGGESITQNSISGEFGEQVGVNQPEKKKKAGKLRGRTPLGPTRRTGSVGGKMGKNGQSVPVLGLGGGERNKEKYENGPQPGGQVCELKKRKKSNRNCRKNFSQCSKR